MGLVSTPEALRARHAELLAAAARPGLKPLVVELLGDQRKKLTPALIELFADPHAAPIAAQLPYEVNGYVSPKGANSPTCAGARSPRGGGSPTAPRSRCSSPSDSPKGSPRMGARWMAHRSSEGHRSSPLPSSPLQSSVVAPVAVKASPSANRLRWA